jgi:hypothetical protein
MSLKKQIQKIQAYQSTWYIGYKQELLAQLLLLFFVASFEPIEPSFISLKGQKFSSLPSIAPDSLTKAITSLIDSRVKSLVNALKVT